MPVINGDKKTLLIRCKCHSHVLEITNDDWGLDEDGSIPDFDVSVWNQTPVPMSFKERLKLIWHLIRGKNLDGGDVIIEQEDAQAIIQFLDETLESNKARLRQYAKTNKQTKKAQGGLRS